MSFLKNIFKKKSKGKDGNEVNHHFIFVEAPLEVVSPEVIRWGEASWWPKKCTMEFVNTTPGAVKVGTVYGQNSSVPLVASWEAEVTKLEPQKIIERTFRGGVIKGYETVKMEWRVNGTRIDYEMVYQIQGIHNKILWKLIFERMHDKNIKMILTALKDYVVKIHEDAQNEGLEGS